MNLQQVADEAMAYLDSVGVAADWSIIPLSKVDALMVNTDIDFHVYFIDDDIDNFRLEIMREHPQKSPN